MQLTYNPAIALLSIYHREIETPVHTGTLIAALLLTGKTWKQPKTLSVVTHTGASITSISEHATQQQKGAIATISNLKL